MNLTLKDIGVDRKIEQKLSVYGVRTVKSLLKKTTKKKGRKRLAKNLGLRSKVIKKWHKKAALLQLDGFSDNEIKLFESANIFSRKDLKQWHPADLFERLVAINAEYRLAPSVPSLEKLEMAMT